MWFIHFSLSGLCYLWFREGPGVFWENTALNPLPRRAKCRGIARTGGRWFTRITPPHVWRMAQCKLLLLLLHPQRILWILTIIQPICRAILTPRLKAHKEQLVSPAYYISREIQLLRLITFFFHHPLCANKCQALLMLYKEGKDIWITRWKRLMHS